MAQYIKVTQNDVKISNTGEYLKHQGVPLVKNMSSKEFLDYEGDTEKSNLSRGTSKLTTKRGKFDNLSLYTKKEYDNVLLPLGTEILIPVENVEREVLFVADSNVLIETNKTKAYISLALAKLFKDKNYTQKVSLGNSGELSIHNTSITVYMWCRSLSNENSDGEPQGGWFDVSPFVLDLSTKVSKGMGSFSLSLAPVIGIKNETNGWEIDHSTIQNYSSKSVNTGFVAHSSVHDYNVEDTRKRLYTKKEDNERSKYFFHQVIQENDLFFIRFEKLENEKSDDVSRELSQDVIPNNTYDMIGLVDRNVLSYNSGNNDVSISIAGRDFMKIFQEDGSYFFPEQFSGNMFALNGSRLIGDRSKVNGKIQSLSVYLERSIMFTLQFIVSQLATTGLVPNSVFDGYEEETLNKSHILPGGGIKIDKGTGGESKPSRLPGIWSIISMQVDPGVAFRKIIDSSISQEQGSMINSINKICQDPFVEFWGDTYGDKYVFQARKPPFDRVSYLSILNNDVITDDTNPNNEVVKFSGAVVLPNIRVSATRVPFVSDYVLDILEENILTENLSYGNEAYSWYQLKLVGTLFGTNIKMPHAYVPAISFDEYANVWGSRVYSKQHSYVSYSGIQDENDGQKSKDLLTQVVNDFRYIIESNALLPFVRLGQIVINGNRTFKRGSFIRLVSTDEIYYVDEVANNWSIDTQKVDRTTTLTVSRGMKIPYIDGVDVNFEGKTKNVSYFDIISTKVKDGSVLGDEFSKNWKVDPDIFNFFLKRNQWK